MTDSSFLLTLPTALVLCGVLLTIYQKLLTWYWQEKKRVVVDREMSSNLHRRYHR